MNDHDRSNLEFLMSLVTHEQWMDWAKKVGQDDLEYAMELIYQASVENELFLMELNEVLEEEIGMNLTESCKLLKRFMLH